MPWIEHLRLTSWEVVRKNWPRRDWFNYRLGFRWDIPILIGYKTPISKKNKWNNKVLITKDIVQTTSNSWRAQIQSIVFLVGSAHPGVVEASKGWSVRPLKRYVSWVQTVVRQVGLYPLSAWDFWGSSSSVREDQDESIPGVPVVVVRRIAG